MNLYITDIKFKVKYLDFGDCFPYYDICELEKIQISEENSYE